ncbi:unnamed protein product [Effrenium voratum]|nr:unnamed protein product [Effrenium voratum]
MADAAELSFLRDLRAAAPGLRVKVEACRPDAAIPEGAKKIHFVRHGEGQHNVAQREWRLRPDFKEGTEPYTVDQDPDGRYFDADLTELGEGAAWCGRRQGRAACGVAPAPRHQDWAHCFRVANPARPQGPSRKKAPRAGARAQWRERIGAWRIVSGGGLRAVPRARWAPHL